MLQVAICDSERESRDLIESCIAKIWDCKIRQLESVDNLLKIASKQDIILLDAKINKADGIEAAKAIRKISNAVVIFVTAYPEYVFDAFDVHAFHYLLKPLDEKKFRTVFERAVNEVLPKKAREPLFMKVNGRTFQIPVAQIIYAESQGRKICLHTKEDSISFYATMETMEERLGDSFFRCHRGYLVNLGAIVCYDINSITLQNGEVILLARQKYQDFTKMYEEYTKQGKYLFKQEEMDGTKF